METALATKTEEKKTSYASPGALPEVQLSPREGLGAPAGMPLFLQRLVIPSFGDNGSIQRQIEEEEESEEPLEEPEEAELLQTKLTAAGPGLIQRRVEEEEEEEKTEEPLEEEEEFLQTKLTVGQPGDVYEQEADRVADTVMHTPEPESAEAGMISGQGRLPRIQRQYPAREQAGWQAGRKEAISQANSGRSGDRDAPEISSEMENRINANRGKGEPLPKPVRASMESHFGYDFSGVRVHADADSAEVARDLNAQAFTRDQDIYFDASRYQPDTAPGQRLLAHELTHTVQQGAGGTSVARRAIQPSLTVIRPGDPLEQEAGAVASQVVAGQPVPPGTISSAAPGVRGLIARQTAELPTPNPWTDVAEPTEPVEALAEGVLRNLRVDPEDRSGRVRRRLARLDPATRETVLARVQASMSPAQWERLTEILAEPAPPGGEETPPPPQIEEVAPYEGAVSSSMLQEGGEATGGEAGELVSAEADTAEAETAAGEMPEVEATDTEAVAEEAGAEGEAEEVSVTAVAAVPGDGLASPVPVPPQVAPPLLQAPVVEAGMLSLPQSAIQGSPFATSQARDAARARLARLMERSAAARARLREQGMMALTQLAQRIEMEKARVVAEGAQARDAISARYAGARDQTTALFESTRAEIESLISQNREMVIAADAAELGRLQNGSTATVERLRGASSRYDQEALAIGEQEASRALTNSEGMAGEAMSMGESRAAAATGDETLREMKAEAVLEVASETAKHIREVGSESADAARSTASEAQGAFGEQAEELIAQVEEITTQAQDQLPGISQAVLERLGAVLDQTLPQLEEAYQATMATLDDAENLALETVNQSETNALVQLDQMHMEGAGAIESQIAGNDDQLVQYTNTVRSLIEAENAPDQGAVDAMATVAELTLDGRVAAFGGALQQSLQQIDIAIAAGGDAFSQGLSQAHAAVEGQIDQLLGSLESNLTTLRTGVSEQLAQELADYQQVVAEAVDSTLATLDELTGEMERGVDQALQDLRNEITASVDEALAHNQAELDALGRPSKLTEAERRAEEEYNKSFWEKVWDAFVSALLIGLLVFVLPLVVIGLIFGAKVALIVGLLALAFFVGFTIGTRLAQLWIEGAPWYNWVIYLVALPFIAVPDALGLVGILEGATGYDIITWRKLSEDEAAARLGSGLAGAVLVLVSLGLAKVAAPRGAPPPGVRGAPPGRGPSPIIDPTTGRPFGAPPEPRPIIDPTTGRPFGAPPEPRPIIDPTTGRPVGVPPEPRPIIDPRTGRPVVRGPIEEPARPAPVEEPTRPAEEPARPAEEPVRPPEPEPAPSRELGLRDAVVEAIESLENIKSDPLGEVNRQTGHNHYRAARREARGEVVARRPDGRPYSHIRDLQEAFRGLQNVRRALELEIRNPPDTMTERGLDVLLERHAEVQRLISRLMGFLHSIGFGPPYPPFHGWPPGA